MTSAMTPTVTPSVEMKRDDRDERLLALREQVAQRDVQFEGQIHDVFSYQYSFSTAFSMSAS